MTDKTLIVDAALDQSYDFLLLFAQAVQDAMNEGGVVPPATHVHALMLMVASKSVGAHPVGCSLNYVDGTWRIDPCAADIGPGIRDG